MYKSVDCDGDGIKDHTCRNTKDGRRWLILSTEGCPRSWGSNERAVSKCPAAWNKGKFILAYGRGKLFEGR